jgi:phospholipase/lecithinase/hemolysin
VAQLPTAIPQFAEVGVRLNPELARLPADARAAIAGIEISASRWGAFFDEVMRNPGRYGIENTTDRCAGRAIFNEDATPCAKPSASFFYHAGHPSTAVHRVVGDMLVDDLTAR